MGDKERPRVRPSALCSNALSQGYVIKEPFLMRSYVTSQAWCPD